MLASIWQSNLALQHQFVGSSMQPPEILTTKSSFVRTGSGPVEPNEFGRSHESEESVSWQQAMKRAVRSAAELRKRLGLPIEVPSELPNEVNSAVESAESDFRTFVPLEFLSRMKQGDPSDPLLRQVLVTNAESEPSDGFAADPVGDLNALSAPGVLHKYDGRALLITTGACGVHCRYCFRREFPYSELGGLSDGFERAIDYLSKNDSIHEAILSGGDPLTLTDETLFEIIERLESMKHVQRLRIHSRMPIVIPQRVTLALVDRLAASRLAIWMVVHANHPQELDETVFAATDRLIDHGIPVLNQAVLLRKVNDRPDVLVKLCTSLVNHRIQPYYLHQLDRVQGAAHFEVPREVGIELMNAIRRELPGYAVPRYVWEQAGEPSKSSIA